MTSKELGKQGEDRAADYLRQKGYCILDANYHSRFGEIDLIAENGQYLVFVEVKTRKPGSLMAPAVAVTVQKQKKVIQTALAFLGEYGMSFQPRFDVAEIIWNGTVQEIRYIENAFTTDGLGIVL